MNLTKYSHACIVVESSDQSLVVDPGNLSEDLVVPMNVCAIVVTHQHPDHVDPELLDAIVARNPDVTLYAHADVIDQLDSGLVAQPVSSGQVITVGPFNLEFYGGDHAVIHEDMPPIANLGVIINNRLAYPGDALTTAPRSVDTLLLPLSAPWCKISEVIDFARDSRATRLIPTHDAVLSPSGKAIYDRVVSSSLPSTIRYERLTQPTEVASHAEQTD